MFRFNRSGAADILFETLSAYSRDSCTKKSFFCFSFFIRNHIPSCSFKILIQKPPKHILGKPTIYDLRLLYLFSPTLKATALYLLSIKSYSKKIIHPFFWNRHLYDNSFISILFMHFRTSFNQRVEILENQKSWLDMWSKFQLFTWTKVWKTSLTIYHNLLWDTL